MKPVYEWVKLNTDNCSKENSSFTGYGDVFRDSNGYWMHGFAALLGVNTNMMAELMAIREGLKIAGTMCFKKLIVESDSMAAVTLLTSSCADTHPLKNIVEDCLFFTSHLEDCIFQHVFREGN